MLARRLKSTLWTSPLICEGPLHSDCLCFDFDQSLLLILLIDLLIWHVLILLWWQSSASLMRSLRLDSGIQISILNQSHLLLLMSLTVVTLVLTNWQGLLFIYGLNLSIHAYRWLLIVGKLLSLCEEESASASFGWGLPGLLLLDSKLWPHWRLSSICMIHGLIMLICVSISCTALESNSFEPFTHTLSFHLLQFNPHKLVLMLQFLNLRHFPSLVFEFGVLFFQNKQLLVNI